MVVTIGRISASCPACGHYSFRSATKHPRVMDTVVCRRCGAKAVYGQLLERDRSGARGGAGAPAGRAVSMLAG
jgi:hypothetical protein